MASADSPLKGSDEAEKPNLDAVAPAPDAASLHVGANDTVAAGQVDPVYEAKARVLNHAARDAPFP